MRRSTEKTLSKVHFPAALLQFLKTQSNRQMPASIFGKITSSDVYKKYNSYIWYLNLMNRVKGENGFEAVEDATTFNSNS